MLTAGIVCVVAAIAGGGLKAFGIEVPALTSLRRQALLALVGVALLGALMLLHRPKPDETAAVPAAQPTAAAPQTSGPAASTAAAATIDAGSTMRRTQLLLARIGLDPGPPDGRGGAKTIVAIRTFQRLHGLPPDGVTGPQTLRLLHEEAQARGTPAVATPSR